MKEVDDCKILGVLTRKCLTDLPCVRFSLFQIAFGLICLQGELFSVLQSIIMILLMAEGSRARTVEVVQLGIIPRMVEILTTYDYLGKEKDESDEIEDLLFTAMRILNNIAKESDELYDQVVAAKPIPCIIRVRPLDVFAGHDVNSTS